MFVNKIGLIGSKGHKKPIKKRHEWTYAPAAALTYNVQAMSIIKEYRSLKWYARPRVINIKDYGCAHAMAEVIAKKGIPVDIVNCYGLPIFRFRKRGWMQHIVGFFLGF